MNFKRQHHIKIQKLLNCFNSEYLEKNNILFGGGTRISLELNEFRESIDVDFLCPSLESYKAVRSQVTNVGFGDLLKTKLNLVKEIRINRDAVRAVVLIEDTPIKLELVNINGYNLKPDTNKPFGVPMVNRDGCFLTKALAHSDRQYSPDNKDMFDILMMSKVWGKPADSVWENCERIYGKAPKQDLIKQLKSLNHDSGKLLKVADSGANLSIDRNLIRDLLLNESKELLSYLSNEPKKEINHSSAPSM
ncbi:nucleotidyl transferase AbiEii/AbiGii toxin family protein [Pseudoalteromonas sp. S554]|uniref:nucleotidyl transferase AbiEii/AbiGii toxin family protein n=1 Tax=Pseudoalteromonas sp. S554 TaxID=2066516 RepID=UPI00110CD182|nr:nucleotidyl transferase AbiEii/AbiGii toxin family protein [Pseudoalteromonas sp. S554]TMS80556.1 hypothetical protein CWB65_14655 [Pseudoalteromonas sp. S554]